MRLYAVLLGLLLSFSAQSTPKVDDFVRFNDFNNVKISPTGKYLGVSMVNAEGKIVISVLERQSMQVTGVASFSGSWEAGDFFWVNNDRVAVQLVKKFGLRERPFVTGNLFAMDADGSRQGLIFGPDAGEATTGTHLRRRVATFAVAELMDRMEDDDKHILIQAYPFSYSQERYPTAYQLDVYSGRLRKIVRSPIENGYLLADNNQQVRFALGFESQEENKYKLFQRSENGDDWQLMAPQTTELSKLQPVAFTPDNQQVYLLADAGENRTKGLFLMELSSQKITQIYHHESVDIDQLLMTVDNQPLAVSVVDGVPALSFFDTDASAAKLYRGVAQAFAGHYVGVTSMTRDGALAVLDVSNDRNAGDFYLFDTQTKQVAYLLSRADWQDPEVMAAMTPVVIKSRDGLTLNGYLTKPNAAKAPYPLVVMPHGGPIGVRDYWQFDPEVQFLASRGYAVLQVNYRGSGGYGDKFKKAGHKQWGRAMQNDLTDATRWAIDAGVTQADSICMVGASYGAYASLMAAVQEPTLYQCVAGLYGVYDLTLLDETLRSDSDALWLQEILGADRDTLERFSPINYVEKIRPEVMLVHGDKDLIAPIVHYQLMAEKLQRANKPFVSLVKQGEGHGFYLPENRKELYLKLADFLDKNIGAKQL